MTQDFLTQPQQNKLVKNVASKTVKKWVSDITEKET